MIIRKRQQNADTGVSHISTKDWADSTEAQISIEAQIDKLDVDEVIKTHLRTKLNFDELPADETEAMEALRNIAESVNSEIDKFNAGQILSTTKGGSKFVDPQTLADQTKSKSEEINRLKDEESKAKTEDEKKKIREKYKKLQDERDKLYEDISGAMSTVSTSMLDTGKKLMSGDGQQAVDAFLNIIIGIGAFLSKTILAAVHKGKARRESKKMGKELEAQDKALRDAQALVDEIAAGNHDAGMEPATAEEVQEIVNEVAQEEFEEVGEIETWDDAFKYGFAKLKQIHGLKYDEAKARETLEGLKESYPDNPKVVIGALKYGGGHKKKDDEQKNSRKVIDLRRRNARPQLRKVYREFGDAAEAYNWIMDTGPMEDPIATIRIDGKVADLKWDSNGEQLVLESINLPTRVELFDDSDWIRKNALGDMFDHINQQIREYGE